MRIVRQEDQLVARASAVGPGGDTLCGRRSLTVTTMECVGDTNAICLGRRGRRTVPTRVAAVIVQRMTKNRDKRVERRQGQGIRFDEFHAHQTSPTERRTERPA